MCVPLPVYVCAHWSARRAAALSKDFSLHFTSNSTFQKRMWTSKRNMESWGNLTQHQQQQQQLILIPHPQAGTLLLNSISHIFDRICTSISKPASLLYSFFFAFFSYIWFELSAWDWFRLFSFGTRPNVAPVTLDSFVFVSPLQQNPRRPWIKWSANMLYSAGVSLVGNGRCYIILVMMQGKVWQTQTTSQCIEHCVEQILNTLTRSYPKC